MQHCPAIHHELRRPGVTLLLLWEEYRAVHLGGYGYSRWCELYRSWEARLSPTMRQAHPAGERLFVDYAGHTVEVVDGSTGELRAAQVFVAVLGASNYTYAVLYQSAYALTVCAQARDAMDRIVSGAAASAFQAMQHASTMAS